MNDVAFVDSSSLIVLAAIGRAELLRCAADRIVVPNAVATEIRADVGDTLTPVVLRDATWIETGAESPIPARIASWDLGAGEPSVLALAGVNAPQRSRANGPHQRAIARMSPGAVLVRAFSPWVLGGPESWGVAPG